MRSPNTTALSLSMQLERVRHVYEETTITHVSNERILLRPL
jgi:hypothetical protein